MDMEEENQAEYERARTREAVTGSATVSITGLPIAAVEAAVEETTASMIRNAGFIDLAGKQIAKAAREAVAMVTPEVVREQLGLEVAKILAEGVPEFDSYNGQVKKHTSVQEMVAKALEARTGDHYDRNRPTLLETMVKAAVQEVFTKELTKVVDDAKVAVRQQVDAVVTGRLSEALRAALGVK